MIDSGRQLSTLLISGRRIKIGEGAGRGAFGELEEEIRLDCGGHLGSPPPSVGELSKHVSCGNKFRSGAQRDSDPLC